MILFAAPPDEDALAGRTLLLPRRVDTGWQQAGSTDGLRSASQAGASRVRNCSTHFSRDNTAAALRRCKGKLSAGVIR
ncbi:hypothetical protein [Paracraurococcus ruber]|uniref:Uncharacterized protein n=1 Tax=Paracraurococcus ruber TaxID=77675 RepID=A0ABS1D3K9_9PROT|nr:hypothetical protein [Paracraurococcus ruber]MBK1660677.1 hypothetical protein [Paracraurococcus ruber]TDG27200.1 hypothetical protein E2C05_23725 [Paracraurococcus ruber]